MAGAEPPLDVTRTIIGYAGMFLTLDVFISLGPLRSRVDRWFGLTDPSQSRKASVTAAQFAMRVVGLVFISLMSPCVWDILTSRAMRADKLYTYDRNSQLCMALAAAYFVYDIVLCLLRFRASGGAPFLGHAIISLSAFLYGSATRRLHYFGAAVLVWEASTPLLYARWFLLKTNRAQGPWLVRVNYSFMLTFFLSRLVWGPIVFRMFYSAVTRDQEAHPDRAMSLLASRLFWAGFTVMVGLNLYWFSAMIRAATGRNAMHRKVV